MTRHSWRALRNEVGFSFVELLVTMIIAGIIFSALIPVFVMAAKKSSLDNSRNVAVNLAQGRLEKIRGLQYDQILDDSAHLNDPDFANGQFKTPYDYDNGVATKTFLIDYQVDFYPATAAPGKEDYKQVQVLVSWAPSEADITAENSVILRTLIYKQYAGPAIIGPPRITSPVPVVMTDIDGITYQCVTDRNMTIEIDVDPNKAPTTLNVIVGVYSATGELIEQIPENQVACIDALNHWRATWTAPDSVNDGSYVIKAVAMSTTHYLGNTASTEFQLELGPPDDVTGLTLMPGDRLVELNWVRPTAGDVDHYEIYRSTTEAFDDPPIEADWQSTGYSDPPLGQTTSLENGQVYYYKVVAVDIFGQASEGASESVTPAVPTDVTPPYPPTNLTGTASELTITLTWTASPGDVDTPPLVSQLGDYYLYQSAFSGGPWTQIWQGAAVTTSVTHLAYNQTMYYKVTAKDLALNESAPTNTVAVTSRPAPLFDLAVWNSLRSDRYVRVHSGSLGGPLVGTTTSWYRVKKRATNVTNWRQLTIGKYYVEWSTTSAGISPKSDSFTQLSSTPYTFRITD